MDSYAHRPRMRRRDSFEHRDERLRALRDALRAAKLGDFSVRLPTDGAAEGVMGEVALAFNAFSGRSTISGISTTRTCTSNRYARVRNPPLTCGSFRRPSRSCPVPASLRLMETAPRAPLALRADPRSCSPVVCPRPRSTRRSISVATASGRWRVSGVARSANTSGREHDYVQPDSGCARGSIDDLSRIAPRCRTLARSRFWLCVARN